MNNQEVDENGYEIPKDQFGRLIQVGDILTYPGRSGSSLYMRQCLVIGIRKQERYSRKETLLITNIVSSEFHWDRENHTSWYTYDIKKCKLFIFKRSTIVDDPKVLLNMDKPEMKKLYDRREEFHREANKI